ncbi:peptide ABC transporter substrate-binding protein [Nitrosomonas sp. JL21]|uniref:ABC transporter substrate-binding protein n=1 Tax=Nitrosomonas sp. JL21 TaxID=153949 RepID=UPI00136EBC7E|nr:ABC transporter substrate-binding protein [Nitrosomonas sp. JL21]MBL8497568.1 ABC transporter substrate-binding protein [Nitrosomonas sp.]MXS77834.1 peptide ABC transporter substrate-binding protein [Nitrosomonas sp. JL21]
MGRSYLLLGITLLLSACGQHNWNSPYPATDSGKNILYSVFSERPKHLDPVQSYSSNEIQFTAQIYEPPLQYHYLRRPFELIPLTVKEIPVVKYFDRAGKLLSSGVDAEHIAYSVYDISIKPGIYYQPHPAFAKNKQGNWLYHNLNDQDLLTIFKLGDFSQTDTRELIAEDYIYQIKRLAHPKLHSPIYELMADYIVGLRDYSKLLSQAKLIQSDPHVFLDLRNYALEGVQLIDRYTYRITIKGKYPQFIYWLAMPFFAPIPWEADAFHSQPGLIQKNITLDWYPIGTGPYMLTENNPNLRMILEKNPHFHDEYFPTEGMSGDEENGLLIDAGKKLPLIDKIVFTREKESIPRWNKFLQGYYDATGIGSDSFDQAVQMVGQGEATVTEEMAAQGIRLETTVAVSTYYIGFNMLDPVVGGKNERGRESARKLRQALSIAVDYEEFISIFANGRGLPAQSPIAPGIAGYREGEEGINPVVYEWVNEQPQRKSIDVAKRLLAEAGYPNGIDRKTGAPLILHFDVTARSSEDRSKLDWMRKQFQKLNIQLVIRSTDYNRFQDKIRKGNAQIFEWGWNADYPDPENFLFLLYGPQRKVGNNGENAANYDNKEYNQLFEKMKDLENGVERQRIIDRMLEILRQDAPWIWGYHPKDYGLYHAWYQNVKPNRISNNNLKYFKIDASLRERQRFAWNEPILWPIGLGVVALIISFIPAIKAFYRRERSTAVRRELLN